MGAALRQAPAESNSAPAAIAALSPGFVRVSAAGAAAGKEGLGGMPGAATPAPLGGGRGACPPPHPSEYQNYSFTNGTQPPLKRVLLQRGTGGEEGGVRRDAAPQIESTDSASRRTPPVRRPPTLPARAGLLPAPPGRRPTPALPAGGLPLPPAVVPDAPTPPERVHHREQQRVEHRE